MRYLLAQSFLLFTMALGFDLVPYVGTIILLLGRRLTPRWLTLPILLLLPFGIYMRLAYHSIERM